MKPEGDALTLEQDGPEETCAKSQSVRVVPLHAVPMHNELSPWQFNAVAIIHERKQAGVPVLVKDEPALIVRHHVNRGNLPFNTAPDDFRDRKALQSGIQQLFADAIEGQSLELIPDDVGRSHINIGIGRWQDFPFACDKRLLALLEHGKSMGVTLNLVVDLEAFALTALDQRVVDILHGTRVIRDRDVICRICNQIARVPGEVFACHFRQAFFVDLHSR